ncbi:MAG: AGE family epimerase/isomerase [Micrococcales bacterium]|nr:AGE family epimerase/isomerase [Micrococcales bacterium]
MSQLDLAETRQRQLAMARGLLEFGAKAAVPTVGFGYLDSFGQIEAGQGAQLWVVARMTHCFSIGALLGWPGAAELADLGLTALAGPFQDQRHGGWFARLSLDGEPVATAKEAYGHAFVVLAAASALAAGRPGASHLLDLALDVVDKRFWEPKHRAMMDRWNQDFTRADPYRGANSNMHTVEAFLAASDVTGVTSWRQRALDMTDRIVNQAARSKQWRVPEHYTPEWRVLPEFNRNRPADQFRPYGATPGHGFEWARLATQLRAAIGRHAPAWLSEVALELYQQAKADGWADSTSPGLIYTTNWRGDPVLHQHLHWVVAEATAAAATLGRAFGGSAYGSDWLRWWDLIERHFVDQEHDSWFHELDASGQPAQTLWQGKPDIYHAFQACLMPHLPVGGSLAATLARGHSRL